MTFVEADLNYIDKKTKKISAPISFAIHGGKLQVVVSNRCDLIRARSLSITRSITSTPTTLGFNGFGYF